jgi:hypothetical protein
MKTHYWLCFFLGIALMNATPQPKEIEVGTVKWGRDLKSAQKESAQQGKPILALFQEVPG